MKLHSLTQARIIAAGCSIAFLLPLAARADQWNKKTILTVNEEIQVQDRVLEPGKYVFKLLNTNADRHVVQIYNGDETHIIDTVAAIPEYRVEPTGKSQFRFWETPSGYVKALRAWYYPGDNFGQGFVYPKHLTMLTAALMPPPAPIAAPQPQPMAQPEPAAPMAEPVPQEQPAPMPEIAQNAAPAEPSSPAPAPMQNNTLPKTASPYPLIGLAGLAFVGAFGLLRLKRAL